MTNRIDPRKIVRYAIECAGLAAFCAKLDLPELLQAVECADRSEFSEASRLCRSAAARYAYDAAAAAAAAAAAYAAYAAAAAAAYAAARYDADAAAYDAARYAAAAATYAVYAAAAYAGSWAREQCARRAKELFLPEFFLGKALRQFVAAHIEAHPELHDQTSWGDGEANPACGTPCCVAGWACHLGGGSRGLSVATMASALLYVEGKPEVPFDSDATREQILTALRA